MHVGRPGGLVKRAVYVFFLIIATLLIIIHSRFLKEYTGTGRITNCDELIAYLGARGDWDLLKPLVALTILSPLCAGVSSRAWKHMTLKGLARVRVLLLFLLCDCRLMLLVDSTSSAHAILRHSNI